MGQNLSEQKIYKFIINDFEGAWDSIAKNPSAIGRCNFIFARQDMILLEFLSRLCSSDSTGKALKDFSKELSKIEPKYFTRLPSSCPCPRDFDLPYIHFKGEELLWAIFDMVRHGQAHQYQQILVNLSDGLDFQISLTGADYKRYLKTIIREPRPNEHLGLKRDKNNDLWLILCPEFLFLDIKNACNNSTLFGRGLSFSHLTRPRKSVKSITKKGKKKLIPYSFKSSDLETSLINSGHSQIP